MKLKKLEPLQYIVVHCSATPPHMDIGRTEIDRWHRERSWLKIGYHAVIRRNGDIEMGRAWDEQGAHVQGHNHNTIGICLVGGVDAQNNPHDNFTAAQIASLEIVLAGLIRKHPKARAVGHRDLDANKACPSFDVRTLRILSHQG